MSIEEVKAVQARSKSGRNGPWISDFNEMAKKTAFRRLSKWLPLSAEFRDAVEADDEHNKPIDIEGTPVKGKMIEGFSALLQDPESSDLTEQPAANEGGAA